MTWEKYWKSTSFKRRGIEFVRRVYFAKIFAWYIHQFAGKPSKILEAGCGSATYLKELSKKEHILTGIDKEESALAIAKKNYPNVMLGDIKKLPFVDKSFDIIFNQGVMEHFNDQEFRMILREFRRVAPKVAIILPASTSLLRIYDIIGDDHDKLFFSKKKLEKLLQTEFQHVRVKYLPATGFLSLIGYGSNLSDKL